MIVSESKGSGSESRSANRLHLYLEMAKLLSPEAVYRDGYFLCFDTVTQIPRLEKSPVLISDVFLPVPELIHAFLVKGIHDFVAEGSVLGTIVEISKLVDSLLHQPVSELRFVTFKALILRVGTSVSCEYIMLDGSEVMRLGRLTAHQTPLRRQLLQKGTIVQMKRERLMDCLWKQQLNKDGSQDVEASEVVFLVDAACRVGAGSGEGRAMWF
ncbi:hypothetical protein KCU68_g105, partial [Aureobasidium melanogenum]